MAGFFDQLDGAAAGWLKTWLTARDRRIDNDRSLTASRKDQLKKYYRSNPYLGILHRAAIENPSAFTEGGEYSEFKNFQDYDPEHNAKLRDMLVKAPDEAVDEWIYTHKPMAQRFESIMDIKHAYPNDPDAVKKIYGAYTEDTPENMDHFIKNHVLVEPQIKNRLALMKSVNDAKRYILFRKEPGKENVPLGGSEMLYTQAKDLENVLNSGNDNEIAEAISGDSLKFLGNSVKTSQNSLWREMSGILGPRSIEAKRTLVDILANEYPKQFSQDAAVTEIVRNPMYHWNALRNASSVSRTADFLSDYLEYKGRDNEKARQALRKYLYEYAVKPQIGPSERDPEPHPKKPIRTGVVEDPDWNNFVDGKIKMEAKQYNIDQGLSPLDEPTRMLMSSPSPIFPKDNSGNR